MPTMRQIEKYATDIENQIRADALMPLRTHYVRQGSGGWEPSRILQHNNNPIYGHGANYITSRVYFPRLKIR